ncbi:MULTISPECIES: hypothetical protein [unclassified Bradyrhizobium]|nr:MULTISPECIES: hypothetical protein [unclassified Bradyrhizobium]
MLYQSGAEQIDAEWNAAVAHSKLGDPVPLHRLEAEELPARR